jgi:dephospho-CoA kinase
MKDGERMQNKKIYFNRLFELYNKSKIVETTIIIFIVALIIDKMNIFTSMYVFGGIPLICGIILLILIFLFELYLNDLVFIKVVNYFDLSNIVLFLTSLLYLINYLTFEYPINKYKLYLLIISICLNLILFVFRLIYINSNKQEKYISNIIDLKDAYENKFPISENNLYFIDEAPVEYDLLERTEVINNVYYSIKQCRTEHQYVIGLTGSWGSGKTTILKNVKRLIRESNDDDLILIDSFDPWIYEDKTALFRAMFDTILSKIGLKFSIAETNRFIDYLTNIIFGHTNLDRFRISKNESKEIQRIKNIINNYLKDNNKRIVFIIDNIERANKENILLILKSAFSIFNFERIIYIISYDKERMQKILNESLDTDYEYIEKIIQNEIEVPQISKEQLYNINYKVIMNILGVYGISENDKNDLDEIIQEYSKNIKDLRELKRNINSIISVNYVNKSYLNKIDSFIIKYISLKDSDLINKIYTNRAYFVSEDYSIYQDDYVFNTEKYNKDVDQFFTNLFSDTHKKYINLLSICFPNVKQFRDKYFSDRVLDYRRTGGLISYDRSNYYKTNKEKRIYDGKFFDLYFTNISNEFLEIDILINNFVKNINDIKKNQNDINVEYMKLLNLYNNFIQKYTLETLEYYLDDIQENKLELTKVMYNNIRYCDNTLLFFGGLTSRSRAEVLVSNMICKLNNDDFNKFLTYIENDYKNLYVIREINYWLNPENRHSKDSNEEYYNLFSSKYESIKNTIIDNSINIYSDTNYGIHNIYCFWGNDEQLKNISKKINKNTVYKFLADMIGTSVGSGYGYRIREDVEKVIKTKELEKILDKATPKDEKERFILKVFEATKETKSDFDDGYRTDKYFDFDLSK